MDGIFYAKAAAFIGAAITMGFGSLGPALGQAINFAIVYLLLRTFLFRPVVKVIDTELSDRGLLLDSIHHHKKVIENQENERERLWRGCREYFRLNKPDIHHQRVFVDVYK